MTLALLKVAGIAPDGTSCEWFAILSYQYWWIFLLPLESGECSTSPTLITPKTIPATNGDRTEQHIQPKGTKKYEQEKCITDPN
jgi:hypothetical protein